LTNNCGASGTLLTINLSGALSDTTGATQYRLVISSMILARTYKTSSNFKITSLTPSGSGVQTTTVSSILNNQPNKIQTLTYTALTLPSQLNTL
jgi:hypothetical protein